MHGLVPSCLHSFIVTVQHGVERKNPLMLFRGKGEGAAFLSTLEWHSMNIDMVVWLVTGHRHCLAC